MYRDKKVVLIGPVFPFRGGIAQHTTMLKRAIAKKSETLMLSFSRQYPAWLFPGESDRDPAYKNHYENQTEYIIDSMNPFSWIKAVKRVISYNPTIVIIPWWTVFWAPCFGYMTWALKRKGIHIVFFCHNVVEHEAAAWKNYATRSVLKNANSFVVHTSEDKDNLLDLLPDAHISVQSHPIYDQFPAPKGELHRRKALELLFYGFVRPYKGLDDLIDAMALLKDDNIQLTIAGEFWKGEKETSSKIQSLGLVNQIEMRPRYHTEQETAELFKRADVVVLPYRSATGSGVVPIAYHYNKPVIVTNVGGLPDVVIDGETGWLLPPDNIQKLSDAIKGLDRDQCHARVDSIKLFKKSLSWENMAEVVLKDYE